MVAEHVTFAITPLVLIDRLRRVHQDRRWFVTGTMDGSVDLLAGRSLSIIACGSYDYDAGIHQFTNSPTNGIVLAGADLPAYPNADP